MTATLTGYNVHTEADRQAMLEAMGLSSLEQLLEPVPKELRLKRPLDLAEPQSEWALEQRFQDWARLNRTTTSHCSFLGAGAYQHHIPAVIDAIASRGEFLTAYTPYQPEMSQGLLRVLYDFQI